MDEAKLDAVIAKLSHIFISNLILVILREYQVVISLQTQKNNL